MESEKKAMALAAAVGSHTETLRSLPRRNTGARDQNALRSILEAHERYTTAYEEEVVQREIAKHRSRTGRVEWAGGTSAISAGKRLDCAVLLVRSCGVVKASGA